MLSKRSILFLLLCAVILSLILGLSLQPFPQPQSYHDFADTKSWLGIPNAWNVLSNIPLALSGIWGLILLFSPGKIKFIDDRERWFWITFSLGLFFTALGSAYYHQAPNNSTLFWDRIAMMIIFMPFVSALIGERIDIELGLISWPLLLGVGLLSVCLWLASEHLGAGDLRYYLVVHVFATLVAIIMILAPQPYTRNGDIAVAVVLLGIARVCEALDKPIHHVLHGWVGGHPFKHLFLAVAAFWLVKMLWQRKMIKS